MQQYLLLIDRKILHQLPTKKTFYLAQNVQEKNTKILQMVTIRK